MTHGVAARQRRFYTMLTDGEERSPMDALAILHRCARRLQLDQVGTVALPLSARLTEILSQEHAPCPFTPQDIHARTQPERLLPDARSVIVVLFPYRTERGIDPAANLSRYTWSRDYHLICRHYLDRLGARLAAHLPDDVFLPFVDTSPLPDRYLAYAAGLGFFGRHRSLINPRYGTYVTIGGLITTHPFPAATVDSRSCYACNRCLTACPGNALTPTDFDYTRCKSYLTQKKGDLSPEEIAILRKNPLVFGCDTCQDVCPHNEEAALSPLPEFAQDQLRRIDADTLTAHSNRTFRDAYGDRAWAWRGKGVLLRNHRYLQEGDDPVIHPPGTDDPTSCPT